MVSLILSLFFLPIAITLLLILHLNVILVVSASPSSSSSSSSSIQCRSGWSTNTQITISPSQINDGYCDCPYDGYDEPNTDACSGSMDGGWAGISPRYISSDLDAAKLPTYFSCPQQPTSPRAWRLAGPIWSTSRTSSSSWWTQTTMVSGRWQSSLWRWLSSHRPTEDPALHLRFMFFSFILGSRSQF